MAEDLQLFILSEAKGNKLLTIEVPANVYRILQDLAFHANESFHTYLEDIIYEKIDRELQTSSGVDSSLAAFLKKKYNYRPMTAQKVEVKA